MGCVRGADSESGGNTTTTSTTGGDGGGGAATTATGGSGGHGGSGSGGTVTTTDSGGAGGCDPGPNPCGQAICGFVTDACNDQTYCGTCDDGQVCTPAGACCAPFTCTHYPSACNNAIVDNGCGEAMICGNATCGDGTRMSCLVDHCVCQDGDNDQVETAACPGAVARYCGDDTVINKYEAQTGCVPSAVHNPGKAGNPLIWCCQ